MTDNPMSALAAAILADPGPRSSDELLRQWRARMEAAASRGEPVVLPEMATADVWELLRQAAPERIRRVLAEGGAFFRVELARNIRREPHKLHRAPGGRLF